MLSTRDFAHEVWLSLENIRERLAVLETEARHTRCHLQRLEERLEESLAPGPGAYPPGAGRGASGGYVPEPGSGGPGEDNGAVINVRISRRALGGGALGSGALAVLAGVGKALGWW